MQEAKPKKIPDIVLLSKTLRRSPLFNLSLGSKELFHSNFLAWLFEMYPKEAGQALAHFLKNSAGDTEITLVRREEKHRDLTIYFKNKQELIIENKVKSLPYIDQLQLYSEGAKPHQNFLLLSLVPPPFSKNNTIKIGDVLWNVLTYSDLSCILEEIAPLNKYHKELLDDYVQLASSLGDIFCSLTCDDTDIFSEFYSGPILERLHSLRVADIYQKLRFEALARRIYAGISQLYPKKTWLSEPKKTSRIGHVYISHDLTNAQGLVSISYILAEGLTLTIQIQGGDYRQMVQGYLGFGGASFDIAERLKAKHLWFDFSHIEATKEYPCGAKQFNKFKEADFYRRVRIPSETTIKQLVELVARDVRKIFARADDVISSLK